MVKLLLVLSFFQMSCFRQPAVVDIPKKNKFELSLTQEPFDAFEFVLWHIKTDTSLFQKYLHESTVIIPEKKLGKMEEALVIGEVIIHGKEFKVTYNLAKAVLVDENSYQIPFLLENLTDEISKSDKLIWHPTDNDSGVLLSFDDRTLDSWMQYFDMFEGYGAKATFFVFGRPESRGNNSMNLAKFCNNALNRGHDIGFHTVNHYNLTKVSRSTSVNETIEGAKNFINAGIPISAFAYPYGLSLPWLNETLSPVFPTIRGFKGDVYFYNLQTIGNGYIVSKTIDNILYRNNEEFENEIRLLLLITKFTGNIIIPLTTHDISDTALWGIKPSHLEFLLGTIQELKLKFYTYHEIRQLNP